MNPALVLVFAGLSKKYLYIVLTTIVLVVTLPLIAVLSLGQNTISILSFGTGTSESDGLYQGPLLNTDTYAFGNCTYWAAMLRSEAGKPIPNSWGNANTWAINARLQGYSVDHTPSPSAIMQTTSGDLGHVAYVTSVDPVSGDWTISEMNVKGLDIVDTRVMPASSAANYNFIHDEQTML
jgi:surface antigen